MSALVLVDIQNDFLPGGALAVADGDAVIAVANRVMTAADQVIATQDWHPPDHESFAAYHPGRAVGEVIDLHGLPQVLWPVHCVQQSAGAAFAERLNEGPIQAVFRKGMRRDVDSYSGFFDNGRRGDTGMGAWLRGQGVEDVWVLGLATDYCVRFTALDAASLGFHTTLVVDGCRGVDLAPGDVDAAVAELRAAGIAITTSDALLQEPRR